MMRYAVRVFVCLSGCLSALHVPQASRVHPSQLYLHACVAGKWAANGRVLRRRVPGRAKVLTGAFVGVGGRQCHRHRHENVIFAKNLHVRSAI